MKKICCGFSILFVLLLFVPCLHIDRSEISEKEKRPLAVFKGLTEDGKFNLNFGRDFEKFYNDRFFGRDFFVNIHSAFAKNMGRVEANGSVIRGKDGWLFIRKDDSDLNYTNSNSYSEEELAGIRAYVLGIKNWCDRNGKKFVWFIAPDKNKIYGEYFNEKIVKTRPDEESRTCRLIEMLRSESDIDIIYPRVEFLAAKENSSSYIYYKTDTHWSDEGAYLGYRQIVSLLGRDFDLDEAEILGVEDTTYPSGDLTALFPEAGENDATVYSKRIISEDYEMAADNEGIGLPPVISEKKGSRAPSVCMIRDSFTVALRRYISSTFSRAVYSWNSYEIDNALLEEMRNSDIIILETVERYIPVLSRTAIPND